MNIENAKQIENENISNFETLKIIQPNEKITFNSDLTSLNFFENVIIISDLVVNVKANYEDLNLNLTKLIVEGVEWVLIEIFNYNEIPANVSVKLFNKN